MSILKAIAFVCLVGLAGCQRPQPTVKGLELLDQLPDGARTAIQPAVDAGSRVEGYQITVVKPATNPDAFTSSNQGDEIWCIADKLDGMTFASTGLLIRRGDIWHVSHDFIQNWNEGCQ